jgi:hypothetical protein
MANMMTAQRQPAFTTSVRTTEETNLLIQALVSAGVIAPITDAPTAGVPPPSADLQAFLNAIPIAQDGDVITQEYHNSLRAAIARIAAYLGDTAIAPLVTVTAPPVLRPITGASEWELIVGGARVSHPAADPHGTQGWMPLDVPNGTRIESYVARGRLQGPKPASWPVRLVRREIIGGDQHTIGTANVVTVVQDNQGVFAAPGTINVDGASPAELEGYRRVDSSKYLYFLSTDVIGLQDGTVAELDAIEVTCSRSI